MLTRLFVINLAIIILSGASLADWDDAAGRGLIPFWTNAGDFNTLLVFVNGHEETSDVIHIRFCDHNGRFCSDTTGDMYGIRQREMLTFSTTRKSVNPREPPLWIPT